MNCNYKNLKRQTPLTPHREEQDTNSNSNKLPRLLKSSEKMAQTHESLLSGKALEVVLGRIIAADNRNLHDTKSHIPPIIGSHVASMPTLEECMTHLREELITTRLSQDIEDKSGNKWVTESSSVRRDVLNNAMEKQPREIVEIFQVSRLIDDMNYEVSTLANFIPFVPTRTNNMLQVCLFITFPHRITLISSCFLTSHQQFVRHVKPFTNDISLMQYV